MLYDEQVTVIWNTQLASTKWVLPLGFSSVLRDNHLTAAFAKCRLRIKRRTWRNGHKLATTLIKTVLEQLLPALGRGRLPAGKQHGGSLLPVCGPLMDPAGIQRLPSHSPTSPETGEAARRLSTGSMRSPRTLPKEPQRENKCLSWKRVQLQITLCAGCRNLGSFAAGSLSRAGMVLLGTSPQCATVP